MDVGVKELQLRVHSSFSERSPFVEVQGQQGIAKRSPSILSSRSGSGTHTSLSTERRSAAKVGSSSRHGISSGSSAMPTSELPIPSVLQLGHIQSGAMALNGERRRLANRIRAVVQSADFSLDEDNEQCVEDKLKEAHCLRAARTLGLPRLKCSLRNFKDHGGFRNCVKQVVQNHMEQGTEDSNALDRFLKLEVLPFCGSHGVDFDGTLIELVSESCKRKDLSDGMIQNSSFLARCCESDVAKCRCTLTVMRAALFCGTFPRWLTELSQEALSWASSDTGLTADVQEVSRLLTIHRIILNYCGHGASELFRVENPRHATRLLAFMTKRVQWEPDAIADDIFALCNSFTHLSTINAFSTLVTNAISFGKNEIDSCNSKLLSLYRYVLDRDHIVGKAVLERVLQWSLERLREDHAESNDASIDRRISLPYYCRSVRDLSSEYTEFHQKRNKSTETEDLYDRELFETIVELQSKFGLVVSPVDVFLAPNMIQRAATVFEPAARAFGSNQRGFCKMSSKKAQKACSLLAMNTSKSQAQSLWAIGAAIACCFRIESGTRDFRSDEFLRFLGIIDGGETNDMTALASLSVGRFLCQLVFSDKDDFLEGNKPRDDVLTSDICRDFVVGASLLRNRSIWVVARRSLPRIAWLSSLIETNELVFTRTDMGLADTVDQLRVIQLQKSWNEAADVSNTIKPEEFHRRFVEQPVLNSSWYIGDGLMLPPNDMYMLTSWSFRELQCSNRGRSGTLELLDLANIQGTHSLALRILVTTLSQDASFKQRRGWYRCDEGLMQILDKTIARLAERCLGGSKGGMTSGVIDSQLAAAFLLTMPKRVAFKLYKSAIPMALKTNSYDRLLVLANLGKQACSQAEPIEGNMFYKVGWNNQTLFLQQCQELGTNALWWKRLSSLAVHFDQKWFTGSQSSEKRTSIAHSANDILSPLITAGAKKEGVGHAMALGKRFASIFADSSDMVDLLMIIFLITPPTEQFDDDTGTGDEHDARRYMKFVTRAVRDSIRKVRSCSKRVAILRDCLMKLESTTAYGADYERFSLVLSLYNDSLLLLLDHDTDDATVDKDQLELELEFVDRKRDALAILGAHFSDRLSRPNFSGFFISLKDFLKNDRSEEPGCLNVLGQKKKGDSGSLVFDPLAPLQETMNIAMELSAAVPLTPLSLSLGIPQGYIHTRFLMARFRIRSEKKMTLPSFNNDVSPVIDKLRSHQDKMLLAEWCADQYNIHEENRLLCIQVALDAATNASHDLEASHSSLAGDDMYTHIKRLSKTRTALSDSLAIKAILDPNGTNCHNGTSSVVDMILGDLSGAFLDGHEPSPEQMVEILLVKGSHYTASASLDTNVALSSTRFRAIVTLIVHATKFLEQQHSHIHPESTSKRLARQLLFYGREVQDEEEILRPSAGSGKDCDESFENFAGEDDTINFVMDLTTVQRVGEWESGEELGRSRNERTQKTSDEEPFSSRPCSRREICDQECHIVSLRVVFLLAFADLYTRAGESEEFLDEADQFTPSKETKKDPNTERKRGNLQSKLRKELDSKRNGLMMDSARDLLRIVFSDVDVKTTVLSSNSSFAVDIKGSAGSSKQFTVTYSMRHRALRAAAFLFPQKILQTVVDEEKMFPEARGGPAGSLKDCSFGTFVASEIEEMGLPLPHSDLSRLSSMDFSSYSRALWRNHGSRDLKGSRGRLLLLLFEMGLRSNDPDTEYLRTLLGDMGRHALPRSILLSLEALVVHRQQRTNSGFGGFEEIIEIGIKGLVDALSYEVQDVGWNEANEDQWHCLVQTVKRISRVTRILQSNGREHQDVCSLLLRAKEASERLGNEKLSIAIQEVSSEFHSSST